MKFVRNKRIFIVVALLAAAIVIFKFFSREKQVDFITDVKPILNKKCITCHGGVKAKAGFSLLFPEEALGNTESGKPAIVPGHPGKSEMIRRITNNDPEERMPYKHDPLSKEEISILRKWIKQGAKWGDHWAYLPVAKAEIPDVENKWIRNDIDRYIYDRLKKEKLAPSPEADKPTLLRRVSLDLTGVYPSPQVSQQFLQSKDDKAYEILVDSLLASPHFGERWAAPWLDLARYSDTKGYESDNGRTIWRYRDWLIKAFNDDMPYDKFLTEQIAGDLLPDPTDAQYIATAFSRNTMNNDEGGTDNEEFRIASVMDRVNTTWEGLMGTTFACVQCHSHPYDPFRHDEYYKFMAYFNNTRDEDIPPEYPVLREYDDTLKQKMEQVLAWTKQHSTPEHVEKMRYFLRTWQPSIHSAKADSLKNAVIGNMNYGLLFRNHSVARLKNMNLEKAGQMIWGMYCNKNGGTLKMRIDKPDGPVVGSYAIEAFDGWRTVSLEFPPQTGVHDVYITYDNPSLPAQSEITIVFDWFGFIQPLPGPALPGYAVTKKIFWDLINAKVTTTPIMIENPLERWRRTNVFDRGNFRTLGKEVEPGVPNSLSYAMPANAPRNRVGLSMWLTDKRNPLVSRTMANRLWEQLFGNGIVETLEDMGTQGLPPTHQELLDYLSWKLMNDHAWSIKKLLKEIVMSATYRQDSKVSDELKEKDPTNKLYARMTRVRLSAEQLRDQHLCISGEISKKMFGPSVMPWQPEGIWLSPYNGSKWTKSEGEDQYRRAVYTFNKRTAGYPSMMTFDGEQRDLCNARRIRTNTPLQALVTLNDSAYLDMARHFASRMKKEAGDDTRQQIEKGYELMLYKAMPAEKLKVFTDLYNEALREFNGEPAKAKELMAVNTERADAATAALIVVANAMLNLDEVIMKN
jgi:hypothetical protein